MERRQSRVVHTAERSTAIVSGLFPKSVARRLMEDVEPEGRKSMAIGVFKKELTDAVNDKNRKCVTAQDYECELGSSVRSSEPIAELFPEATVFFADIGKSRVTCFSPVLSASSHFRSGSSWIHRLVLRATAGPSLSAPGRDLQCV